MPFASLIDQQGFSNIPKPKAAPTTQTNTYGPVGTLPPATGPLPPTYHGPAPPGYEPPAGSPPAPPPPPVTGFGGQTILNPQPGQNPFTTDPGYQMALGQEQLGISQLNSALKSAQERAIINFGDPSLAAMAGFGLDPQAAAFARQNYLSGNADLARLDKQKELQRKALIDRLAARNILGSGDLGYGLQEADTSYGNAVYDSRQKVLDYLNGLVQNTLGQKRDLRSQVIAALQNAYQNYASNPAAYGGASYGQTAPPVNAPSAQPAQPLGESAAARALRIRSQALNRLYGLG